MFSIFKKLFRNPIGALPIDIRIVDNRTCFKVIVIFNKNLHITTSKRRLKEDEPSKLDVGMTAQESYEFRIANYNNSYGIPLFEHQPILSIEEAKQTAMDIINREIPLEERDMWCTPVIQLLTPQEEFMLTRYGANPGGYGKRQ